MLVTTSRPVRTTRSVADHLVKVERKHAQSMSDDELRFRESQARRAMRRAAANEEDTPLWLTGIVGLTATGILPAVICPLLFGFGLD